MKQRTLSPLPLGIAGMILSEQTNATILNTLHGVRHSLLSSFSSTCSWVAPLVSPQRLSGLFFVSFLAPLVRWVGPFLLRSGPTIGSSCPVSPSLVLFTWVFMSTGASVHRRGRCIGVFFSQVYVLSLVLSVLVCLSVDVTGALVLL